ncbi:methyl coenzyme M reductase system, component A2 [Methanobacterium alkalithermotolerans]|uniref:Methyl coenzyme M reductase system, component A2 n=1 Tax=Methanobacterium alkalithermotolerans TaxID=2731220 RepID=A0A8T8K503_9EURY|nr:methyl coenzyme M reductase system, component A2 [Methanobacterium alkalithermotolerans]QUH23067.1 methyl coenzyme M reductase system, component A2 [Methanobacterium alkalithermotolerans]RJS48073.1 MAG: methyl coenzyme M reductase system, component A2 [Methanobacterium sp.]
MSFIVLENITKSFKGVPVLKNLNLTINEGQVLGILGRSGSGKSVLINMLRGMKDYKPDEGSITYNIAICQECLRVEPPSKVGSVCGCGCGSEFEAQSVNFWDSDRKVFAAIKRRISIMLQRTFALYEDDTVIDNVIKSMIDVDYEESTYRALDILELSQMTHRITHIARDLSGGEKQRVVLARQIAKDPMLFLADEPTGTLDPKTAELLHQALIEGVKEKGVTMVVTSHWPEVMKKLSDYVIWLEKGEIIAEGNPTEIVEKFMAQVPLPEKGEEFKSDAPIIEMKEVKKHYYSIDRGVVKAVDGVNLTVDEGEIFGVVGLSGAGKTTLSRILFGLTDPSSGEIMVRLGENWIDMTQKGPVGRGRVMPYLGILHQEYSLYPHRNVLGNLTEAISLELPAEFAKMKAIYVLKAVGFDDEYAESILKKSPDELSGGERHRVALAQVLIKEPNIIILDEPTGTMDPITRVQVTDSIIKAREELNQTFLIISHDMEFVLDVCDRACLMRGGKILKIGEPESIIEELTPTEKEKMLGEE